MTKFVKPELPRSQNNYDTNELSDATGLKCEDPSLTQQQFLEESDINYIADKYGLTGELPQVLELPKYGDFTGIFDYQGAQNAVIAAQQQFMTLPAKLRARFDNDPQKLLAFLEDDDNRAEAEFLGLVNKKPDKPVQDLPESPKGDADVDGKGDTPSQAPEAPAKPPKTPKT